MGIFLDPYKLEGALDLFDGRLVRLNPVIASAAVLG
jgi:hypothetical protein